MDTREKLEQDVRQWLQSRLIGNDVYETVISWLDRQESITVWERIGQSIERINAFIDMKNQRDELQAKVDELTEERDLLLEQVQEYADEAAHFEQSLADVEETHMRLPVDADGVPIHLGDVVAAQDEQPFEVRAFQLDALGWFAIERLGSQWNVNQLHHVQSDTVESLLEEFTLKMTENMGMYTAESIEADEWKRLDEDTIADYAERIRRAVEHDV